MTLNLKNKSMILQPKKLEKVEKLCCVDPSAKIIGVLFYRLPTLVFYQASKTIYNLRLKLEKQLEQIA